MHERMGESELGSDDMKIVIHEDVNVDDAVVIMSIHGFDGAPHSSLNVLRDIEYLKRGKRSDATNGRIDKRVDRLEAPRFGNKES